MKAISIEQKIKKSHKKRFGCLKKYNEEFLKE